MEGAMKKKKGLWKKIIIIGFVALMAIGTLSTTIYLSRNNEEIIETEVSDE